MNLRHGARRRTTDGFAAARLRRRAEALPRRRPVVVGLSGLNGAGKSSLAAALVRALAQLDVPSAVVWTPVGQSRALDVIGLPAKNVLRRLRFGRLRQLAERSAAGSVFSNPVESDGANGRRSRVTAAWATFVALLNVLSQRRELARHVIEAHVIVYDRHALDSIVQLRFRYGNAGNLRLQRTLIRRSAPKADLAYYLDVQPEIAHARKQDGTLEQLRVQRDLYAEECDALGVQRLEGDASREDLCARIAADVWRMLAEHR